MSGVPPELRDYVEPLVRVGYVTQSVYERCVQEALRLGLSAVEGDAVIRSLADEHGALLEAPPAAQVAAEAEAAEAEIARVEEARVEEARVEEARAEGSALAVTTAWTPPEAQASDPEVSTRGDVLEGVPSDSEERRALEDSAAEAPDGVSQALLEAAPDEEEPADVEDESGESESLGPREGGQATEVEGVQAADSTRAQPSTPPVAGARPALAQSAAGKASPEDDREEAESKLASSADEAELEAADEDEDDFAGPAPFVPGRGPGRIPWLQLSPLALAPFLALAFLLSGGIERVRARFGGGDPFEPNNTFATAHELAPGKYTGLTLIRDDVDWFRLRVPAGRGLRVTYELSGSEASVSLHDSQGVRLERVGASAGELVYVPQVERGSEEVYLALSGSSPDVVSLEVALIDPRLRFEENDLAAAASEVPLGRVATLACDGQDWFRVTIPAFRKLRAALTEPAPGIGLRLFEFADAGQPKPGPSAPRAELPASDLPRAALIQVTGQGDYGLQLDLGETDAALARSRGETLATFSETLEPNDSKASAVALEPGFYPNLRCDGKDYYWVTLPADHSLTLEWEPGSVDLSFPGLRSRVFGDDLDSVQGALHRRVVYAKRDLRVLVLAQGSGPYPLRCKVTPGLPGRRLQAGSYPQIPTQGDDLYWIQVESGQKLDLSFSLGDSEFYGYGTHCVIHSRPLRGLGDRTSVRRTETEYISGYANIARRYYDQELVFLSVRQARRPYDLKVEVGGQEATTEEGGYRPPAFEQIGPGIYPDRGLIAGEGVFAIQVGADQTLSAQIAFSSQAGDLDLELLDSHGREVESSTGSGDDEGVLYRSPVEQRVYLFVRDLSGDGTRFDLALSLDGSSQPAPDTQELAAGLHRGLVCTGEVIYGLRVKPGEVVRAEVKSLDEAGELDLGLLSASGKEVLRSTELGPTERIEYMADTEGLLYLRVVGGARRFDLALAIGAP